MKPRLGSIAGNAAGVRGAVVWCLLGCEVLGAQAKHLRLHAQQDILGNEHDLFAAFGKPFGHLQNAVIPGMCEKSLGQCDIHAVGLHAQRAAIWHIYTAKQISLRAVLFQGADGRAGACAALALGLFQAVQLLEHGQGQDNGVILKTGQRIGRLNEHVGVEYIGLAHGISSVAAKNKNQTPVCWGPGFIS